MKIEISLATSQDSAITTVVQSGGIGFWFLAVIAAMVGTFAGLFLVYTTDLPQIDQLERYHPSATTVLYDAKGREIGSFALQRRVIVVGMA